MMSLSAARRRISVMKQRSNCWHLRTDAAVGARIELGPEMAVLGQLRQLRAIAGLGGLLPVADDAEVVDLFQPIQHRLVGEVVKLLAAEIIAAPLHVADAQLAQVLLQEGDVLEEELLLQGLGAGRDDDALAGADDRQQIGQRFAGAGPGFDDQVAPLLQRLLDRFGHLQLSAAKFVRGMSARQHSARSEELVQRRQARGQWRRIVTWKTRREERVPIIAVWAIAAERV